LMQLLKMRIVRSISLKRGTASITEKTGKAALSGLRSLMGVKIRRIFPELKILDVFYSLLFLVFTDTGH